MLCFGSHQFKSSMFLYNYILSYIYTYQYLSITQINHREVECVCKQTYLVKAILLFISFRISFVHQLTFWNLVNKDLFGSPSQCQSSSDFTTRERNQINVSYYIYILQRRLGCKNIDALFHIWLLLKFQYFKIAPE